MDSRRKGFIIGVAGVVAGVSAVAGALPISAGFGFDATAWYVIAVAQIVSALLAVSYLCLTERGDWLDG